MGTFFRGWQGKVGQVKIAVACVFGAGNFTMFVLTHSFGEAGIAVTIVSAAAMAGVIVLAGIRMCSK